MVFNDIDVAVVLSSELGCLLRLVVQLNLQAAELAGELDRVLVDGAPQARRFHRLAVVLDEILHDLGVEIGLDLLAPELLPLVIVHLSLLHDAISKVFHLIFFAESRHLHPLLVEVELVHEFVLLGHLLGLALVPLERCFVPAERLLVEVHNLLLLHRELLVLGTCLRLQVLHLEDQKVVAVGKDPVDHCRVLEAVDLNDFHLQFIYFLLVLQDSLARQLQRIVLVAESFIL